MEHKVQGWKEKNADQNKRKWEGGNQGNNQGNRNNNRGDNRDIRHHNQNNNRRNGGARAMTQAQGENVNQGGHASKCNGLNMFILVNCRWNAINCGKMEDILLGLSWLKDELYPRRRSRYGGNYKWNVYCVKAVGSSPRPKCGDWFSVYSKIDLRAGLSSFSFRRGYSNHRSFRTKSGGDVFDLIGDEDLTNEDGDTGMGDSTGVLVSLGGEISSGRNLENQTSVEIDSEDKRSLVKSSEESGEMFSGVTRE
ncbi:hypothetical protein Tco_0044375 [Tanacetum coccineum]